MFTFGCAAVFVAAGLFISSCGKRGLLSCVPPASHRGGLSCCGVWALGREGFSSCGTWDLPGPGIKPRSPALAGGRLTTEPAGKPPVGILFVFWCNRGPPGTVVRPGEVGWEVGQTPLCQGSFLRPPLESSHHYGIWVTRIWSDRFCCVVSNP